MERFLFCGNRGKPFSSQRFNQGVIGLPLKGWPLTGINQLHPGIGLQVHKPNLQNTNQFFLASQQQQQHQHQQQQQVLAHAQAQGKLGAPPNYGLSGLSRGNIIMNDSQPSINEGSNGIFKNAKNIECLKKYFDICGGPATFIQVKLNVSLLKDISDDIDFCFKLAKEEPTIILPVLSVSLKNWIRVTFAADPSSLEEALDRVKSFLPKAFSSTKGSDSSSNLLPCPAASQSSCIQDILLERKLSKENLVKGFF
ncbi:unnamed protein product [Lactuca saligna]|uniref:Aminotransferase class I/classII domain-containing protein n=1 Tax=Lactuca saligna TaxID=75948 RepID=A0AA35YXD4_LACSI|nr:unnamed protein product [Lactuca saligna]